MDLDENEKIYFSALEAACAFGEACATYRNTNPYNEAEPLNLLINTLMTELWDRYFSQTEIRAAFENALRDMNRYAAGDERRP